MGSRSLSRRTVVEPLVLDVQPASKRQRTLVVLAPCLLLAAMAALMLGPAKTQSPTIDEIPHIGAALSYLQKFDLRLNGEHPPLAKVLAAVPLVFSGARADYESVSWKLSEKFFPAYLAQWVFGEWVLGQWNDRQQTLYLARLPMLGLTLLFGLVLYACAYQLGGFAGAVLCLSTYVSLPVFLTFGPLVLTDVPVALFCILTLWAFARLWRVPTLANIAWFSAALSAALLTKFSAVLVLVAIAVFIRYYSPLPGRARALWIGVGWTALVVYIVYFALSWNQPMDVQHRIGEGPVALAIGRLLMPPWLYLRGFTMVLFTSSRPAFLLGTLYPQGLPFYFPLLLIWKSPLGFLGLLGLAATLSWPRKKREAPLRAAVPASQEVLWRVLSIACVVFASVCILSRLNISFRHFTIPLALLILLLAPLPRAIALLGKTKPTLGRGLQGLMFVAVVSSAITSVAVYPNYFSYLNVLSGGQPAYRLFGDSNLDWNQALPEVAKFAASQNLEEILVDSYGLSDPREDARQARLWDCQSPSPLQGGQWAVVSANSVLEAHNCEWLIPHIRQTLAGGSMYAVLLPLPIPAAGSANGPPLPEAQRRLFAMPFDLKSLIVDITRHPEKLPAAYADLERRLAPAHFTDNLYPPKEAVQWPWQKKR